MSAKAVVRRPGEGKEVTLAGKPLVFLVTGQDTKHTSMFDWTLPAGFSTGRHVHRVQEETFYVLEGEMAFVCGGAWLNAGPGAYVFGPRNIPHGFKVVGDTAASMLLLYIWILLFGFVGTQLAWTLRPFFGDPGQPFELFRDINGTFYSDILSTLGSLLG